MDVPELTLPPLAETSRGRVVIVDDNALVRATLALLVRRRHDVIEARGGAEAIALMGRGERFDLVVCDLMMPEVDGFEVVASIRRLQPELLGRIVLLSAEVSTRGALELAASGEVTLMEKPFELRELLRTIDSLIAAPRTA